jgi:pyrroloquinoline quinone (PQQ) biosynthesis protein C
MALRESAWVLERTPHQAWAQRFWDDLIPHKDAVAQHPLFVAMANGSLHLDCFRHALLNFYPLVARFPSYMALGLTKAIHFDQAGVTDTRHWLIQNIGVEQRHLNWYRDWAVGFGISLEQLDSVTPPPAMNAVNHFLWSMGHRGSLADSLAATNLAIEWATGDWTTQVFKGIHAYTSRDDVHIGSRTLAWLRAHAQYDDIHPHEAMELIKRLCDHDPTLQKRAFEAAVEGLGYYQLALDDCYRVHLAHTKNGP